MLMQSLYLLVRTHRSFLRTVNDCEGGGYIVPGAMRVLNGGTPRQYWIARTYQEP